MLLMFGKSYRDSFLGAVGDSREKAAWDSFLVARHAVVHKKGVLQLTFRELKEKYPLTKQIIVSVEATLGVSS
jgi:hypothetical protein